MRVQRFLQRRWRGFSSSGMLSCAAGQAETISLKENSAFISNNSGVLEEEGNTFLRNFGVF